MGSLARVRATWAMASAHSVEVLELTPEVAVEVLVVAVVAGATEDEEEEEEEEGKDATSSCKSDCC